MRRALHNLCAALVLCATLVGVGSAQEPDSTMTIKITLEGKAIELKLVGSQIISYRADQGIAKPPVVEPGRYMRIVDTTGEPLVDIDFTEPKRLPKKRPVKLGVDVAPVKGPLASQLDLEAGQSLVIVGVERGAAADRAGVRRHDVVTRIDQGRATREQLRVALEAKKPGDVVALQVLRKGEPILLQVELDLPAEPRSARLPDGPLVDGLFSLSGLLLPGGEVVVDPAITDDTVDSRYLMLPEYISRLKDRRAAVDFDQHHRRELADRMTALEARLIRIETLLEKIANR